ncbi:MAG TPA: flagellar basal body P-ring formation chaperone FlgA [Sphingomonas sp.]|nr:flagellar basal body P-ring formation chaperone FlgA [Sphingomonas sp.]
MLTLLLSQLVVASAPPLVDVPVLTRAVERGEILSLDHFTTAERAAAQARGALSPQAAKGMEAAHRLMEGTIVRATDVTKPQLVRRGEPVTITMRSGGLTITTAGRALGNGAAGELVRVVASTNRTLDGVVEGSGAVRISAP